MSDDRCRRCRQPLDTPDHTWNTDTRRYDCAAGDESA